MCHLTSWNVNDVENLYCPGCHRFHLDQQPSEALLDARTMWVDQVLEMARKKGKVTQKVVGIVEKTNGSYRISLRERIQKFMRLARLSR